ncbi:MAG: TolC family protein, partial [Bryobacteraceae bacterium]
VRVESSRYQQVITDLRAGLNVSRVALDGARHVAAITPVQVESAKAATEQANARYRSGLGTIVEVADAQRLLTQSEIDDALARLNVWRAELNLRAAEGDLQPFLDRAGK